MISYLKSLINKLPPNKLVRVAAISAVIGASVLLLPFVVGGVTGWFAYTKVVSPKLRYPVMGTAVVLALFIGIPWTGAFFAGSRSTAPSTQQRTTPAPTTTTETSKPELEVEKRPATETAEIPFDKAMINDPTLEKGTTTVVTKGINGVKTLTYELTLTDGVQTDKKLVKEEITTSPVAQVTAVGTKVVAQTSQCDPNYSGACVPIASDVDCLGGSGNGPAYVKGPVYVIGKDIYRLDNDGNGIGCEN